VFFVWNANSPLAAIWLHSSVIVSLVKDVTLLLRRLVSAGIMCFLFLMCYSISEQLPFPTENCDLLNFL
jgi:hypothetical protein